MAAANSSTRVAQLTRGTPRIVLDPSSESSPRFPAKASDLLPRGTPRSVQDQESSCTPKETLLWLRVLRSLSKQQAYNSCFCFEPGAICTKPNFFSKRSLSTPFTGLVKRSATFDLPLTGSTFKSPDFTRSCAHRNRV